MSKLIPRIGVTKLSTTKPRKLRYLQHEAIIDVSKNPVKCMLKSVLKSPLKDGLKYNLLVKSTVVETVDGRKLKITNKPSHTIPTGIGCKDGDSL